MEGCSHKHLSTDYLVKFLSVVSLLIVAPSYSSAEQISDDYAVGVVDPVDPDDSWNENKDSHHYKISDGLAAVGQELEDFWQHFALQKKPVQKAPIKLIQFEEKDGPVTPPEEKYDRIKHFGRWIRDPRQQNCLDTRARVLVRESEIPVTYKEGSSCVVNTGAWWDPYTDQVYKDSKEIQIDHLVPLKNTYTNGGWKWTKQKRCLYSNFMANRYHLIPVYGPENMKKSDKTPDKYLPRNEKFICSYLNIWLKTKLVWDLSLSAEEAVAIKETVMQYGCEDRKVTMSRSELRRLRAAIIDELPQCSN